MIEEIFFPSLAHKSEREKREEGCLKKMVRERRGKNRR